MEGMKNAVGEVIGMVRAGQLTPYQTRVMLFDTCAEYGARNVWNHIKAEYADVYAWLNPPAFDAWLSQFPGFDESEPMEEPPIPDDILDVLGVEN